MSVKSEVIKVLEANRAQAISGQEIADQIKVSRAAVWKAIKSLKEEGYYIEATPNRGYVLLENSDVLSSQGINHYLDEPLDIYTYKSVTSTNTLMKKLAIDYHNDYAVIVAEEQTEGRGRFGRSFFSPAKKGIYMSLLIKNQKSLQDATMITIQSAVALTRAIDELYGIDPKIKWVNDLYYQGKKICGILSEAISDFESGMIEAVIIGIGLNVSTSKEEFGNELAAKATSLGLENANRNQLIAEIIKQLFKVINEDFKDVLDEYKDKSCVLNKVVEFNHGQRKLKGMVKDINQAGNLVIVTDQEELILKAGEVSLVGGFNETN